MKTQHCFGIIIICLLMNLFSKDAYPFVTYYVSSSGNDQNTGTSEQSPWKTISKVNSILSSISSLPQGGQILFKRGDKFEGTVYIAWGLRNGELTFGAYFTGNLPIITGKKSITGWTQHSPNIYKANFSDSISHLYVNNKLMTIARYPNKGFLKIDLGDGVYGFYDAALNQPNGYWNGATCRIRSVNWIYDLSRVSSFSNTKITLSSPTNYPMTKDYGYYLDSKYSLLDTAGEWYQDLNTGTVYIYSPNGIVPSSVEGTVGKNGFLFDTIYGVNNVKIQDLNVSGYKMHAICGGSYNSNITVKNCLISHTGIFGIILNGPTNLIDNNTLIDNYNVGITGVLTSTTISNNSIKRTGLIAGYGASGFGYLGMQIHSCVQTIVENNTIDSTGYTGISAGKDLIVRNNIIRNSCLTLNDGSGIDISEADGAQIKNNIITNTLGNIEASAIPSRIGHGIAFGPDINRNIVIQGNTIASNSHDGIYLDHKPTSQNNQIIGNVLYNNFIAQISFTDFSAQSYSSSYNNLVKGNIFYSLSYNQSCMQHEMWHASNFSDFGTFDSNYYGNPYTESVIKRIIIAPYSVRHLRLATWKNMGEDLTSSSSPFSFEQYKVTDTISNNLILNSRFTNDVSLWNRYQPGLTIAHVSNILDTGCMRIRWTGQFPVEGFVWSNSWTTNIDDYYLVSFNSLGNNSGDVDLSIKFSNPDYTFRKFFNYDTFRKTHSYVFKSDTTDQIAITFGMISPDSMVHVDNVMTYRVSAEKIDSSEASKLFINPSNTSQVFSLGSSNYKNIYGLPVSGSITIPAFSSSILINDNTNLPKTLYLKTFIEGMYNPNTNTLIPDTIAVYLRRTFPPYTLVDSSKSITDSAGNTSLYFNNTSNGENYYIVVRHRNSLQTWSSAGISFNASTGLASYDFTFSRNRAYGNNMTKVDTSPDLFAFYSGDVNQDEIIEGGDLALIDNDASNFVTGYVPTDITGNEFVDGSDAAISDNNASNFVSIIRP